MPSTIGKCKLFRIKHTTLLEGETFLRNKHKIAFFLIKCTFVGIKENSINVEYAPLSGRPVEADKDLIKLIVNAYWETTTREIEFRLSL